MTAREETLYRVLVMQYLYLTKEDRISILDMIFELNEERRTTHNYEKWDMSKEFLTRAAMFKAFYGYRHWKDNA